MPLPAPTRPSRRLALAAAVALLALTASTAAQIRHPGAPAGVGLPGDIPVVLLPTPDVEPLLAEDVVRAAQGIGPLRYGVMVYQPVVVEHAASWTVSDDGEWTVARLRISSPGARSLGVEFDQYDLPPEGRVFVYDDTGTIVYGAYTQENRVRHTGEFVIEPFPGDTLVLEYSQPSGSHARPHMLLRGVIHDYRDVFELERGLDSLGLVTPFSGDGSPGDGGCSVNVNCPDGDPFELEKRATVRTLYFGSLCSGVIINNTESDETPYLYTANHCGTGSGVVVRFNYQNSGCTSGSAPTNQNMSGAQLLANDLDTDGRLLRMNNNIPDSYMPYYAGWSRSTANLTFGMSMHHPGGSPKQISIDVNGGGQTTSQFLGIGPVKVWVMNFQIGGTAGGSSGGPLFDQNNRVRGVLTGGSTCSNGQYGRLHSFWNETSIATFLDPDSSGVTFIEGYDPFGDLAPANATSLSPDQGPEAGFTLVTIQGSGFDGVTEVTFGATEAPTFDILSDSMLRATAPAGTQGALVDVTVTDSFGSTTLTDAYLYTANPVPSVSIVDPPEGHVDGGTSVVISGSSVIGVTQVQFGGVPGTDLTIINSGSLEVTTPAAASSGPVDVTVIGNGSDTITDGYLYFLPGEFITLGPGHPGFGGLIPAMGGAGDLFPTGSFTLNTVGARPNAIGALFASLEENPVPFKGGTLYTIPLLLNVPIQASFLGTVSLPATLDASLPPGLDVIIQQAFADPDASAGVSLTNGLMLAIGEA